MRDINLQMEGKAFLSVPAPGSPTPLGHKSITLLYKNKKGSAGGVWGYPNLLPRSQSPEPSAQTLVACFTS